MLCVLGIGPEDGREVNGASLALARSMVTPQPSAPCIRIGTKPGVVRDSGGQLPQVLAPATGGGPGVSWELAMGGPGKRSPRRVAKAVRQPPAGQSTEPAAMCAHGGETDLGSRTVVGALTSGAGGAPDRGT